MWAILDKFGLGSGFCKWVRLLYTAPGASVRMNGFKSPSFRLFRGTSQGCLLSPLLFALAIEPLACLIRASPDVNGLIRGDMEEKISLYADDLLFFMSNVCPSLPVVMEHVKEFGRFSGLGITWEKSMLMTLDPLLDLLPPIHSHFKVVSIKYLGITMSDSPQSYIVDSIFSLLIRFQNQSKT